MSSLSRRGPSYEMVGIDDDEIDLDDIFMGDIRGSSQRRAEEEVEVVVEEEEYNNKKKPIPFEIDENDYERRQHQIHYPLGEQGQQQQQEGEEGIDSVYRMDGPPYNFFCPLTLQIMEEPVRDGCGHCFEKDAILDWLEYHEMCPISRKPMHYNDLIASESLKSRIRQWRMDHPWYSSEINNRDTDLLSMRNQSDSHSQFELMLLPQERHVIRLIKRRAKDRRTRQECTRCAWIILGVITFVSFVALCIALFLFDLHLKGPI